MRAAWTQLTQIVPLCRPPDTIHKFLGLSSKRCQDNADSLELLSDEKRELLRQQVPGWKVTSTSDGKQCIQQEWTLKDEPSAKAFHGMADAVVQGEGHTAGATLTHVGTIVLVQLLTPSLGA